MQVVTGVAMRHILGLIPARGGSKGIPRKNLVPLAGKPLIQYTFEASLGSKELKRIILSTDDEKIAQLGRSFGVEVAFRRPKALATDEAPMEAVVQHAVRWLAKHEGYRPDAVMVLQPTSPFRTSWHIDDAIRQFREKRVEVMIGVCPVRQHPYKMVSFARGRMQFILQRPSRPMRRQEYPDFYYINGAIHLVRTEALSKRISEARVAAYIMTEEDSFDIDDPLDLRIAEGLLRGDS